MLVSIHLVSLSSWQPQLRSSTSNTNTPSALPPLDTSPPTATCFLSSLFNLLNIWCRAIYICLQVDTLISARATFSSFVFLWLCAWYSVDSPAQPQKRQLSESATWQSSRSTIRAPNIGQALPFGQSQSDRDVFRLRLASALGQYVIAWTNNNSFYFPKLNSDVAYSACVTHSIFSISSNTIILCQNNMPITIVQCIRCHVLSLVWIEQRIFEVTE